MIAFLTSSPTIVDWNSTPAVVKGFNNTNGFFDLIKSNWKENSRCIFIASDPNNYEMAQKDGKDLERLIMNNLLSIECFHICDNRNVEYISNLASYDVCILAGGHVPTQNNFFKATNLKRYINEFDGILISISAGSMNCATTVYAQPEYENELENDEYDLYLEGLGITDIQIIPHWQFIKNQLVGDKRICEDITLPNSINHSFVALEDGSFLMIKDNVQVIYGNAYNICDGYIKQICNVENTFKI